MKKSFVFCIILFLIIFWSGSVMAGGELNNSNYNIKYFRDFTPYADSDVIYNSSRLAFEDRNFLTASMQLVLKDYGSGNPVESADDPSLIPEFSIHYRLSEDLSFIASIYNCAGGGTLTFDDGNAATQTIAENLGTITSQKMDVDATYPTIKLGSVYKFSEKLGIGGGLFAVMANKEITGKIVGSSGTASLDFGQEADGIGGFISIHYKPYELWDVAINYHSEVKLDFESDIKDNKLALGPGFSIIKTEDVREDLPAMLSLGAVRTIPDTKYGTFEAKAGILYYFQKDVKWMDTFANKKLDNRQRDFDNGYDMAIAGSWEPIESDWKFYAGFNYTDPGADVDKTSSFKPGLKSKSIGFGCDYNYSENVVLNFVISKNIYDTETRENGDDLEKDGSAIGAGIEYYF